MRKRGYIGTKGHKRRVPHMKKEMTLIQNLFQDLINEVAAEEERKEKGVAKKRDT